MEGARTAVFAIVVGFVVVGSMKSQVEGKGEVHYNPVTTIRVNGSFSMNIPGYNEYSEYYVIRCKITPPTTSSIPETDLLRSNMDTRLRKTTSATNAVRQDQKCGFVLEPVWKTDEGNWTLWYGLYNGLNYHFPFEFSVIGALKVEEPDQSEEVVKKEGGKAEFHLSTQSRLPRNNRTLTSCVVTHPNGTEISISPSTAYGKSRIKYFPGPDNAGFQDGYCNVLVDDIRIEDKGKWTIRANSSSGLSLKRDIILTVKISNAVVIPNEITVNAQKEVSFQLKVLETGNKTYRWDSCSVKAPNGTLYHLNGVALDGSTHSDSIEYAGGSLLKGNCGAKFENMKRDIEGKWILKARMFQSEEVISAATIIHLRDNEESTKHTDAYGIKGKTYRLSCGPPSADHCVLISPTGERMEFDGPCRINITLSDRYIGEWKCSALLPSSWNEEFFTTSLNYVYMELEVIESISNVSLICKPRDTQNYCDRTLKSCILERPNGERILLREGVTTTGSLQRYKMMGGGISQCDCSISIQKPLTEAEYGQWRCIMKYADHVDGGFINVKGSASNATIPEPVATVQRHPGDGLVLSGDPISIDCRSNRPLEYCRLRLPRGEKYAYNQHLATQKSTIYFGGFGLSLGECFFQFQVANPQIHSGKWTIEIGMKDNSTIIEREYNVNFSFTGLVKPENTSAGALVGSPRLDNFTESRTNDQISPTRIGSINSVESLAKAANTSLNATGAGTLVGSPKVESLTESRTKDQISHMPKGSINSAEGPQIGFKSGLSLGLGLGLIGVVVTIALVFIYNRFKRNSFPFGRHNSHDRVLNKAEGVELSYQQ